MYPALSLCLRAAVAILVLALPAAAETYYVSPAGHDSSPGTLDAPVATPGRALELAQPGDTVLLRDGLYAIARSLAIRQAGLTFRSYPGEWARIVGGTKDLRRLTSILIVYASGVTIENVELQGASYYGIKLDEYYGPQSGITIRGVYIHHTGRDGIKGQYADGVLIEDSEVAFSGVRDPSNAEGIDLMGSIGATIRRNYVHDIATNGIYVKAGTRQAVVEANRVERTGYSGILLGSESGAQFMRDGALHEAIDSVARNNVVIDASLAGLGSIAGDNVRFENNTVINAAGSGQAAFRAAPNDYGTATRELLLKNNVFVLAPGSTRPMVQLYDYSGAIVSDSNIWYSVDGRYHYWRESATGGSSYWTTIEQWRSGMNADWASQTADPLLNGADLYRPFTGSPAIDSGETLAEVATDYSGAPRPQGASHDVGAHEGATSAEPPPAGGADPPPAPTDLTATALPASVALSWVDVSSNEDGFVIERAERNGFVIVATVSAGSQSFTDTDVRANRTYTYRVAAFNSSGTSAYSNTATVKIPRR